MSDVVSICNIDQLCLAYGSVQTVGPAPVLLQVYLQCPGSVAHCCPTGASQEQLNYGRRSALLQVPGVAILATICAWPAATVVQLAAPPPATASGNPRQLSTAEQAAVLKALGKTVTKPKVSSSQPSPASSCTNTAEQTTSDCLDR